MPKVIALSNKIMTFRLTDDEKEVIDTACKALGYTKTDLIRAALNTHLSLPSNARKIAEYLKRMEAREERKRKRDFARSIFGLIVISIGITIALTFGIAM